MNQRIEITSKWVEINDQKIILHEAKPSEGIATYLPYQRSLYRNISNETYIPAYIEFVEMVSYAKEDSDLVSSGDGW